MNGPGLNPAAMTADDAAALLHIEPSTVRAHVAAGLPVDDRGNIHLVEYTAWLIARLAEK
jgi:hypothetical protein